MKMLYKSKFSFDEGQPMPVDSNMIPVGKYTQRFNELTGQTLPCGDIYQSGGLISHVRKRHPEEISNVLLIPSVIDAPDYIGKHPKEPNSIELVKHFDKNVMVCVKLDSKDGYFYVASVFSISNSKLSNRLNSGRLIKYA